MGLRQGPGAQGVQGLKGLHMAAPPRVRMFGSGRRCGGAAPLRHAAVLWGAEMPDGARAYCVLPCGCFVPGRRAWGGMHAWHAMRAGDA